MKNVPLIVVLSVTVAAGLGLGGVAVEAGTHAQQSSAPNGASAHGSSAHGSSAFAVEQGYGMMGGYSGGQGYGMMSGYGGAPSQDATANNSAQAFDGGFGGMGSMMNGGWSGVGPGAGQGARWGGISTRTLTTKETTTLVRSANRGAVVNKKTKTITYHGKNVTIAFIGAPPQADGKFVIDGLVNPTIRVPAGSTIHMQFINEDEGMEHGILVTPAGPPYPYMGAMMEGVYGNALIPILPEAAKNRYPSVNVTFVANEAGLFHYICQYPGHAEKGMYGRFVVQ